MANGFDFEPSIPTSMPTANPVNDRAEPVVKTGGSDFIDDVEMAALEPEKKQGRQDNGSETNKVKDKEVQKSKAADTDSKVKDATKEDIKDAIRKLKLKRGDTDIEIEEDALVPVKVLGKTEMVPLKDLYSQYSGKVAYDRKFQDLAKERETFYTDRDAVTNRVNEFHRLAVAEKQPRLAIEYLAEAMGADPAQVWADLTGQIKSAFEKSKDLTPDQVKASQAEEELAFYRRKEELRRQETEKVRSKEQILSTVKAVQAKHGMTQEQFKSSYDDMAAELARSGKDVNIITPEMVGEYYGILGRQSALQDYVNEAFADDERSATISAQLYDVWGKNPELTIDDIKEIAASAYDAPKKRALADRVKRDSKKETVNTRSTPMSWDDI